MLGGGRRITRQGKYATVKGTPQMNISTIEPDMVLALFHFTHSENNCFGIFLLPGYQRSFYFI